MDMAHMRPLKKIASFLGDEEDLSGGTIGEPRSIPEWVHPVREYLNDVFIYKITPTYFDGYPWSPLEYGKQSFCKYLWHFINTECDAVEARGRARGRGARDGSRLTRMW